MTRPPDYLTCPRCGADAPLTGWPPGPGEGEGEYECDVCGHQFQPAAPEMNRGRCGVRGCQFDPDHDGLHDWSSIDETVDLRAALAHLRTVVLHDVPTDVAIRCAFEYDHHPEDGSSDQPDIDATRRKFGDVTTALGELHGWLQSAKEADTNLLDWINDQAPFHLEIHTLWRTFAEWTADLQDTTP